MAWALLLGLALSTLPAALARSGGGPLVVAIIVSLMVIGAAGTFLAITTSGLSWSPVDLRYLTVASVGTLALLVAAPVLTVRLGSSSFFAMMLAAQMTGATLIDHFGLIGATPRPFNAMIFLGLGLIVLGAVMVLSQRGI
jgi:uncharacterized membrane protein YdcZ (DUF606 family)